MGLREYHRKRDFSRTAEPRGKLKPKTRGSLGFVVQKHAASRLHYDFRLEYDGVLKSWAVPKGPSLDPATKRLAMHVEDHPLDYGDFEGLIPKGQYGGGTVMLWDRGQWLPQGDPGAGLRKGSLKFELKGEKLRGSWALVRIRGRDEDEGKSWLLIKERDREARNGAAADITAKQPDSVKSRRSLEEIASGKSKVWKSGRVESALVARSSKTPVAPARGSARTSAAVRRAMAPPRATSRVATRLAPAKIPGAQRGALPAHVDPERATLVYAAPVGGEWLHEIKFDGYRALGRLERGRVRWLTRGGHDWTERFASLSPALEALPARQALIDGEIVVPGADGTSSFQDLQRALSEGAGEKLVYFAFDLLHLDGYDLRAASLEARKSALSQLIDSVAAAPNLFLSKHLDGEGPRIHIEACRWRLEGIVSKRRDQPYRSGRQRDWLKTKCGLRQEFVIGGFSAPQGSRVGLGALLLGVYEAGGELRFSGRVGTGFDRGTLRELRKRLEELEASTPAFSNPPRGAAARDVRWVRPELVCEVEFTGWTTDGALRHPSFAGLREDKAPKDIMRERAEAPPRTNGRMKKDVNSTPKLIGKRGTTGRARPRGNGTADGDRVAGIKLSNSDRLLYPGQGITKLALARFYESIEEWVMPHISGRPLSVLRCPQGREGECFFQKHSHDTFPSEVRGVQVREQGKTAHYLMVDSLAGLIGLVQMGALELHPWGARGDDIERPDRMFFDLDPAADVRWPRVIAAAKLLREALEELGLRSFVKTTGGKGLHVVVPLSRKHGWDEVKGFSRALADQIVSAAPDQYIATASKARRTGKIFIDYLRNGRGSTAIAAYSTRAHDGAPVSMPVDWKELDGELRSNTFTVANLASRLRRRRTDPWREFFTTRQSLTATMRRRVGL